MYRNIKPFNLHGIASGFAILASLMTISASAQDPTPAIHIARDAGSPTVEPPSKRPPMPRYKMEDDQICTTIDFEGLANQADVPEFDGITSPGWLSIIDQDAGGTGNFAFEPSPETIAFWLGGEPGAREILIEEPAGRLGFFYASFVTVTLEAFDADGNPVDSAIGPPNFNQGPGGDPNGTFNKWDPLEVTSSSNNITRVRVSGNVNQTGIDDLIVCRGQRIHSLEITQAIQELQEIEDLKADLAGDREPPVPIIAGKPAVMRIYVEQVQTATTVRAEVVIPGVLNQTRRLRMQPQCDPAARRRNENGCRSIDFYFTPPDGNWTATVRLLSESGDELESHELPLRSRETDELVLRSLSVCHGQDANGTPLCGSTAKLAELIGFLRQTAPTHNVRVSATDHVVNRNIAAYDADGNGTIDDTESDNWFEDTVREVGDLYSLWDRLLGILGEERYYYGMIHNDVPGTTGGIAEVGGRGGMSRESTVRLNREVNFETVAHETGHMLGRRHTNTGLPPDNGGVPPGCYNFAGSNSSDWPFNDNTIQSNNGPEVGFNVADRRVVLPEIHFDWMGYCVPRWISPHTYVRAMSPLKAGFADKNPPEKATVGLFWTVSGTLTSNGVDLAPIFEIETLGPDETGSGAYRIVARGAGGAVLAERRFEPRLAAAESPDRHVEAPPSFFELLPIRAAATTIAVLAPDGEELANLTLSGVAPSVSLQQPSQGDVLSGVRDVRWSIVDPDSSSHTSAVDYSIDGGDTWARLGTVEGETSLRVDFDQIPGSNTPILRVLVSDGVNTGSVTSPPFRVPRKAPTVEIFGTEDDEVVSAGDLVWLQANAGDVDDGFLDGEDVQWTSNLNGDLGSGASLPVTNLVAGVHQIRVEATDSDGQSVEDSLTVRVASVGPNLDLEINRLDELPTTCVQVTINAEAGSTAAALDTVEYSLDGGATWTDITQRSMPFRFIVPGAGFFHLVARAIDEAGQVDIADERFFIDSPCQDIPPETCVNDDDTICLNSERFTVEVDWRDFDGNRGSGRVVPERSDDSGLFYFFSANNWELLVKVLDGCSLNDFFWVFAAATTNVEYTLRVTDSVTGRSKSYFNPLNNSADAITDTAALAVCDGRATEAHASLEPSPTVDLSKVGSDGSQGIHILSSVGSAMTPTKAGSCEASPLDLCLNQDRFQLKVDWRDFQGNRGSGRVVPVQSDDSGLFYFFSANNWEMLVKVLDGCGINDRFWVFSAATTDVEYTLTVTDTMTDVVKIYRNPLGQAAAAVTDTDAFATCP